ncbi:MAG TPA: phosphatidate cytidylyltransferase [Blastocatellia bacterium]|nr:phosphatidate cytidylyltransferase [Blastocatellia bacterium]
MARVLTAIVFLPLLFGALWLAPPIYFVGLAAVAVWLGLLEYYAMTTRVGARSGRVPGLLAATAILAACYFGRPEWIVGALAALVICELVVELAANPNLPSTLAAAATTVFGVLYVGLLGGYIVALRVVPDAGTRLPAKLLTLFFMIVFAGDTGAYYAGRTLGRHKLAPRISPGKTVEGAVGGLAGNVAAALIARYWFFPELRVGHAVPLALAMGVLGILGDLCESMLKRGAQVKDAGSLIPGHGGLLDRLDSMLFNAPVLYYYYALFLR